MGRSKKKIHREYIYYSSIFEKDKEKKYIVFDKITKFLETKEKIEIKYKI